jgi:hypothetical protein
MSRACLLPPSLGLVEQQVRSTPMGPGRRGRNLRQAVLEPFRVSSPWRT